MNKKIAIIGGGNLGVAIAEGLIKSNFCIPSHIIVTKRNIKTLEELEADGAFGRRIAAAATRGQGAAENAHQAQAGAGLEEGAARRVAGDFALDQLVQVGVGRGVGHTVVVADEIGHQNSPVVCETGRGEPRPADCAGAG